LNAGRSPCSHPLECKVSNYFAEKEKNGKKIAFGELSLVFHSNIQAGPF